MGDRLLGFRRSESAPAYQPQGLPYESPCANGRCPTPGRPEYPQTLQITPVQGLYRGGCGDQGFGQPYDARQFQPQGYDQSRTQNSIKNNFDFTDQSYKQALDKAAREGKPLVVVFGSERAQGVTNFLGSTIAGSQQCSVDGRQIKDSAVFLYVDTDRAAKDSSLREFMQKSGINGNDVRTLIFNMAPGANGTAQPDTIRAQFHGANVRDAQLAAYIDSARKDSRPIQLAETNSRDTRDRKPGTKDDTTEESGDNRNLKRQLKEKDKQLAEINDQLAAMKREMAELRRMREQPPQPTVPLRPQDSTRRNSDGPIPPAVQYPKTTDRRNSDSPIVPPAQNPKPGDRRFGDNIVPPPPTQYPKPNDRTDLPKPWLPNPLDARKPVNPIQGPPVTIPRDAVPKPGAPFQTPQPGAPRDVPKPLIPGQVPPLLPRDNVIRSVAPAPTLRPVETPRTEAPKVPLKTTEQLIKENEAIRQGQVTAKLDQVKTAFDKFMGPEEARLSRAVSTMGGEHPKATYQQTQWLLNQDRENLIRCSDATKKINDTEWHTRGINVRRDEDAIIAARNEQWQQVRSNAANPNDPNHETKQAILHDILKGRLVDDRSFGRQNSNRGDNPLKSDQKAWQMEAADALVKAYTTPGVKHELASRLIIDALNDQSVPSQARIKLLDAIMPMTKDTGNSFLAGHPKETAIAVVTRSLLKSHESGREDGDFQCAAINKLVELNDVAACGVLEKLSKESSITKTRELAEQSLKKLRTQVK